MKATFLLLMLFATLDAFSQQRLFPGEFLDINNQKQFFTPFGSMGWDGDMPMQKVPKDSATSTIFAANVWVCGVKADGAILTAVDRFRTETDWWLGPVMNSQADYEMEAPTYDRVWKINASDIAYHRAHFADPGYTPIEVIANWPGNGNTSMGQAEKLAPFHDVDNDGAYRPADGDYPLIIGHQAVYAIFNDHRIDPSNEVPKISPQSMKLEVHAMAYAFACPEDAVMDHSYFIDYTIYNRSSNDYEDVYVAQWLDFDLGNPLDDYVGTDVGRNAFYAYNGDPFDESDMIYNGYGEKLPIQSTVFLKGLPVPNDNEDNDHPFFSSANGTGFGDGTVDNERWGLMYAIYHINTQGALGDPVVSQDYAGYMRGLWKDGTPVSFGGDGHAPASPNAISARYMFPGYSDTVYHYGTSGADPNMIWTEETAGNLPGDRRMFGSTGPSTLKAGGKISMTVAHVFTQGPAMGDSSLALMAQGIDHVRSAYEAGSFACGSFVLGTETTENAVAEKDLLFPNPADDKIITNGQYSGIRLYNIAGEAVMEVEGKPLQIDVSRLPDGLYIFSADAQGKPLTKQLIVSH